MQRFVTAPTPLMASNCKVPEAEVIRPLRPKTILAGPEIDTLATAPCVFITEASGLVISQPEAQFPPTGVMVIAPLDFIASLRAKERLAMTSKLAVLIRCETINEENDGAAIAAKIATIVIVNTISTRVKPACLSIFHHLVLGVLAPALSRVNAPSENCIVPEIGEAVIR